MKKLILTTTIVLSLFAVSCKDKTNETLKTEAANAGIEINESSKTGNFSFDGKDFSAATETQYFGDKEKGNFSILCKHSNSDKPEDPNFELLQVTFVNENDANNSPLKIYHRSILPMTEPEPGIVAVSLSGVGNGLGDSEFTGNGKSTGTITVKDRMLTLKEVVLFNSAGEQKVVNASLSY